MKIFTVILGILLIAVGTVLAAYIGLWLLIIGVIDIFTNGLTIGNFFLIALREIFAIIIGGIAWFIGLFLIAITND